MKVLGSLSNKEWYALSLEKEINEYFNDVFFSPIQDILDEYRFKLVKLNANLSALQSALQSGEVWFSEGIFSGKFNAAISKELRELGAKFDKESKIFRLDKNKLPYNIRAYIYASKDRSQKLHDSLLKFLDDAQTNIETAKSGIPINKIVDNILNDLQSQFVKVVSGIEFISVNPVLNDYIKKIIKDDFTNNVELPIKNFSKKLLARLRKKVQENAFAGYRADKLSQLLQAEHGMSKRRADFIAKQESSLLVSKYHEARSKEIGSSEYVWSTSNDQRVRCDHRDLQGKKFSWSSPPIVDKRTGRRAHPGEDFGCRCVSKPILNFDV